MKYTPLDIQRREFEKVFRGLEESEVRSFLHEVAAEWEEVLAENQKLKEEILDSRERLRQYQDQDRIFRETLLQAQRTREDVLDGASREKELIIREAQFKAEEIIREAQQHVVEMEVQLRNLKMERIRFFRELEALMDRTRRHIQEEAPDMYVPAPPTLNLENLDLTALDEPALPPRRPNPAP
ncbi:DivIVA domain-containing protein [Geothrix sp.]|jgi:cell division initiation protein|uniref:DivIVA domain-containing protein n=1 Tax=Geothrix sp. TaxID=1962974 RepID=UPI0025B83EAC|nr:DivIVA domain-containing protein [Geothrix sp.]